MLINKPVKIIEPNTVKPKKNNATEHRKKRKKKEEHEEKNELDNGNDEVWPGVSQSIAKSMKMLLILLNVVTFWNSDLV